ncbi:radical SAM protein [bacterium]|nr:radical SAM protein [bacterium]
MKLNPKSEIRNPRFQYLVGPVLSRRLGRSLGVDLLKGECTFLCPYCEVRVRHVDRLELFEFSETDALYAEYTRFCAEYTDQLDSVTFSGTGEPTLISNLGDILRQFRKIGPYPLTVITNGSLLWNPRVRENLRDADLVVPSLDAVTEKAWRRVNRPHPDLTLEKYLDGTRQFCKERTGRIWLEVLLVRRANDGLEDIEALGRFLKTIRVDRVQLGSVDRPPAASRAAPISAAALQNRARLLREISGQRVDVMSRSAPAPEKKSPAGRASPDLSKKILKSVRLRPQTPAEIRSLMRLSRGEMDRALQPLISRGEIRARRHGRRTFLQG